MHVYNRSRQVVDEFVATGMKAHSSPRQVAAAAAILIAMLPDTVAVEAVLLGNDRILAGTGPGRLVIDMGTTAVTATRQIAGSISYLSLLM
jgi:3-hydroxyisobutyrate dehydrogenase-like beta-hydroxyacid dehydrogenase